MASVRSAPPLFVLPAAALVLGIWVASTVLSRALPLLRVHGEPPVGWKSLTQLVATVRSALQGPCHAISERSSLYNCRYQSTL